MRVELEVSKEHLASQLDLDMGFTDWCNHNVGMNSLTHLLTYFAYFTYFTYFTYLLIISRDLQ